MTETTVTVRPSYRDLRGLYLGAEFIRKAQLQPGQRYSMVIDGLENLNIEGTLDKSSFIGGLAALYNSFDLEDEAQIRVCWDGLALRLTPPTEIPTTTTPAPTEVENVFDRQKLTHRHVEPFAPGNLTRWTPQTEPDVYMAFGVLSEYTDFRYCCGASRALLDKLGYQADVKPDAIVVDRTSNAYLMAEFKMRSSEFSSNHKPEDVDVLICWLNDAADASQLPPLVLSLKTLLERIVQEGEIDL